MFWNNLSTQEKNQTILKLLIKMAKADLNFQDEELSYLLYFCKIAQLDVELIRSYQNVDSKDDILFPSDEQNRMNILYHLLFVINADANVNQDEERAVFNLAFKLGFNENLTRDFIDLMKLYPIKELPNDAMLALIRKYSN